MKSILLFLSLFSLISCGEKGSHLMEGFASESAAASAPEILASSNSRSASVAKEEKTTERLIIRNADLSVIVKDTTDALARFDSLATDLGGWVVNSSTQNYGTAKRGSIEFRIPSPQFDTALAAVHETSLKVTRDSRSGEDVTDQFIDLNSRLENTKATSARVRGFLDDAKDVKEALAVNVELGKLNEEIEVLTGKIEFLRKSAAFSKFSIDITPDALEQPIRIVGWHPTGIAKDAISSLISALQGIGNAVIWICLFFLPILALITFPLYFIGKTILRLRKKGKS